MANIPSSETLVGFKAYHAGQARDATRSSDWLAGYDGAIAGLAENAQHKAELDAIKASLPRTKIKLFRAGITPRSL